MNRIQEAVCAYLQQESGISAVAAPDRAAGRYPALAVAVEERGVTLGDGGRQALHDWEVTVTAAKNRERDGETALLASLLPPLLRGIPLTVPGSVTGGQPVRRVLSPLQIRTEGDRLTFRLQVWAPVPPKAAAGGEPGRMEVLHLST